MPIHRITDAPDSLSHPIINYRLKGEADKSMSSSFFRGKNCNFNPYQDDFKQGRFLQKFLMHGWLPDQKIIAQNTKVTAFGSCFAEHITKHLANIGYCTTAATYPDIYISLMAEGMVNVHAICQQFEWALENITPPESLWHGFKCEQFGYDETIRLRTRQAFLETDLFIITLGLSEIWYDEVTGGIFWRAVPLNVYDETRHKFRVCSHAETKEKIERIYRLIRKHNPASKILFTLSPVPLAATFRPISCITANSCSKAILRAALDEFLRERQEEVNRKLFYFPSFEIVTELFFSRYTQDNRHPHPEIIQFIMHLFESTYCDSTVTLESVEQLFADLRRKNAVQTPNLANGS